MLLSTIPSGTTFKLSLYLIIIGITLTTFFNFNKFTWTVPYDSISQTHVAFNGAPSPAPAPAPSLSSPSPDPFDSKPGSLVPQKLWYKLGPKSLSKDATKWTGTCSKNNPAYRVEMFTDESGDAWVQKQFSHSPKIVETFLALKIPIVKVDLIRYLILYAEGGIWSDLDVQCSKIKIEDWLPSELEEKASLVVGLEFDCTEELSCRSQFASWTIMAKPGTQYMKVVIDDAFDRIRDLAHSLGTTVGDLKFSDIPDVVDLSGPRGMTLSIMNHLQRVLDTPLDDRNISGLSHPKMLDDLLILPQNAFSSAVIGYSNDTTHPVLVTHMYAGSWKNDQGGE